MGQVPGATTYNLALYYMLRSPLEETPLLERFISGDDSFRNSRFKLIPYISKVGSFGVKQDFNYLKFINPLQLSLLEHTSIPY